MSRILGKRGRAETGPVGDELMILNLIKSKNNLGIWSRHIKYESKLPDLTVNKSLKSLLAKNLIKEVKNIQNKSGKHYMGVEFEPSKEISGGDFYTDGKLDVEFIKMLKRFCLRQIKSRKVATVEGILTDLKKHNVVTFDISSQQVSEILESMVLENEIMEVKSTGLGDYHSIPIGKICYRAGFGIPKGGRFASMPCGVCPVIGLCSPDGLISPNCCDISAISSKEDLKILIAAFVELIFFIGILGNRLMGSEKKDPLNLPEWKGFEESVNSSSRPSGDEIVAKKRVSRRIRQIPEYYFLPQRSLLSSLLLCGASIAGGIGAGMLVEIWIKKKAEEDGGIIWDFDKISRGKCKDT
ncbi:hypothetical protein ACS0TY_031523 [Phlomoides rotata]